MGNEKEHAADKVLSYEPVLAEVRERALQKLLVAGQGSRYSSDVVQKTGGLDVKTTESGKIVDSFTITGHTEENTGILNTALKGKFDIARNGQKVGSWQVEASQSTWNYLFDRDRFSLKLQGSENGIPRSYMPAESLPVPGKFDANGQPWRKAAATTGDNWFHENPYNAGNRRIEAQFLLNDRKLGSQLSFNETREPAGNSVEYRSVVRDMQGRVLGIVEQYLTPTSKGYKIDTSARRPDNFEKK